MSNPRLIKLNEPLAAELRLDLSALGPDALAQVFSGNRAPCEAQPMAAAYAGHQFGQFVPQLGDGRAILLGDAQDSSGRLRDVQLKGSGRTPYSRGGDGRAAVGPVLREYLVSEAMHALGVPTTRSLAAVLSGDAVYRETPLPGAVLTRIAQSHVRVGTFQYFAARGDVEAVRVLVDFCIERHYPQARDGDNPALALLGCVVHSQAALIARWMQIGFIHGVMNTDNMAISGETIDYGPCAFMDAFDSSAVFSSIDSMGRYAFANQPHIAAWNLARLAETLLPLIDDDAGRAVTRATQALEGFPARYGEHLSSGMRAKLGLETPEPDDAPLMEALLEAMQRGGADFTLTFRGLGELAGREQGPGIAESGGPGGESSSSGASRALREVAGKLDPAWLERWRARLAREPASPAQRAQCMNGVNPLYIPRNHRIESVIRAAVGQGDFAPFEELAAVLMRPFDEQADREYYAEPPQPEERVFQTFCGT